MKEETYINVCKQAKLKEGGHKQLDQHPDCDGRMYTVTTIARNSMYGGVRTPVICRSFERAKEIVETNEGDIFECSYRLAVIEMVISDTLYGSSYYPEHYWYLWNDKTESYMAIEVPEELSNCYGYGIG